MYASPSLPLRTMTMKGESENGNDSAGDDNYLLEEA